MVIITVMCSLTCLQPSCPFVTQGRMAKAYDDNDINKFIYFNYV